MEQTSVSLVFGNNLQLPIDLKFAMNDNGENNAKEVNSFLEHIHAKHLVQQICLIGTIRLTLEGGVANTDVSTNQNR